jgi:hypothetical protein
MNDLNIAHANIAATYRRSIAPLFRGDFERVCTDKLISPFAISSAARSGPGITLSYESLSSAQETLRQTIAHLAPHQTTDTVVWQFKVSRPDYSITFSELRVDDPAFCGELESADVIADIAAIGVHASLELTSESVFLTLTAPVSPDKLCETIDHTLKSLSKHPVNANLPPENDSIDEHRQLTSMLLTVSALRDMEESCRRASCGSISDVVGYRSLLSVSGGGSVDTYSSVEAYRYRYESEEFPDKTSEVKLCMWLFRAQEQVEEYDVPPASLDGARIVVKFTRAEATLHIEGKIKEAARFVDVLLEQILRTTKSDQNNHKFAHNRFFLIFAMILGLSLCVGGTTFLGERPGVLVTFGLLLVASYLIPFVVPRLYPYVTFKNAKTERHRKTVTEGIKLAVLSIFLPVVVEIIRSRLS